MPVNTRSWQAADNQIGAVDSHDAPKPALVSMTAVPQIAAAGDADSASGVSIDLHGVLREWCGSPSLLRPSPHSDRPKQHQTTPTISALIGEPAAAPKAFAKKAPR